MSKPSIHAAGEESRRFQRMRVRLFGRCMLSDGREFPCQIVDISPGGLAVTAIAPGSRNERVIVYADQLGRLEGRIVRLLADGFAMTIFATSEKRDKLAAQLTWLANRDLLGHGDRRRHKRATPSDPRSTLTLPDGTHVPCTIISFSPTGAAVASNQKLAVGLLTTLGSVQSRVVRHIDGGFIVEFTRPQRSKSLEANIAGASDLPNLRGPELSRRPVAASLQREAGVR